MSANGSPLMKTTRYSDTQQRGRTSKACLHQKLDPSEYTLRDSIYSVKEAASPSSCAVMRPPALEPRRSGTGGYHRAGLSGAWGG